MGQEWKEVDAVWMGDMGFVGQNKLGGSVQIGYIDGKPGVGPMELLLLGVAGCTGMDIVSILEKKRLKLERFEVHVRGLRAEEYPKVYTEIEIEYLLWGADLPDRDVEQAIQLSEEKYCSASIMLGKTAKMRSKYKIFTNTIIPELDVTFSE